MPKKLPRRNAPKLPYKGVQRTTRQSFAEKKRPTANQKAFLEEARRIRNIQIRKGKALPFDVTVEPERVTKADIERLKKITGKTIDEQGIELPRKSDIVLNNVVEYGNMFNLYIVQDEINGWQPEENWSDYFRRVKEGHRNMAIQILTEGISSGEGFDGIGTGKTFQAGDIVVAKRLEEESASQILDMIQTILYSSNEDRVNIELTNFATYVKGASLSAEESKYIQDRMESIYYGAEEYRDV